MEWIALVSAGESDLGKPPPGFMSVGGLSLVERQVRQALSAGAAEVWLIAADLPEDATMRLAQNEQVRKIPNVARLTEQLSGETRNFLLFQPGVLIDKRLISLMANDGRQLLTLVFRSDAPEGAERLDAESHWAGLQRLAPDMVRETLETLGDWELTSTMVRAASQQGSKRLRVDGLSNYAPERRRHLPFLWYQPATEQAAQEATEALINSAQKGCLDWPARFIHPVVENQLVRWLLPTPITPNMVTAFGGFLGLVAIFCFATGYLWWGLALVLIVGPLDGADGKLARTRHEFSRWGDLEHVLDKILEYGWFLAIGWWFSTSGHGLAAWLVAGAIIVASLSEAVKGEWFRRITGRQLDDWGKFERRFRIIGGRRNTYFWSWIPFAAFGLWWQGMLAIMVYAVITWAVSEWRFLKAIGEYGSSMSSEIRNNFERTAYAFMSRKQDNLAGGSGES